MVADLVVIGRLIFLSFGIFFFVFLPLFINRITPLVGMCNLGEMPYSLVKYTENYIHRVTSSGKLFGFGNGNWKTQPT